MEQGRKTVGVGVGVVIRRGSEVLLMRRKTAHGAGAWSTPGGHMEFGETPEQCAVRETAEETGLVVSRPRFLALTNDHMPAWEKHYVTIWIEADYQGGTPTMVAPEEMSELGWYRWQDLPAPLFTSFENFVAGRVYGAAQ